MRRGTNVGKAYVSVTADGSGINEEIVDAVDDAGPEVRKKGKEHGEDYGDEFGDSLRVRFSHVADAAGEELNRRLSDSAPDTADDYGDNFEKRMNKSSKRIGRNIGKTLGDEIGKTLKKRLAELEESIGRQMDHLVNQVSGNGRGGGGGGGGTTSAGNQQPGRQTLYQSYDFYTKFEAAREALHKAANDAIAKDDADLVKTQQRLMDKLTKENTAAEKQRSAFVDKFMKARIKMQQDSNKAIFSADQQLVKDQQKLYDSLAKEAERRDSEMWKVRNATAKAHYKYLADLEKGRIDREGNAITRATRGSNVSLGDRIGGLLGKGSRNNFLNFFGSTLGNIVGLIDKTAKGAKSMFDTFSTGWKEAGEGASIFQKAMGGGSALGSQIGGGLLSIAKAGPAAAAAIVVVVVAMSAMVSVASALLALVVALTSTIASALTGAVLVLGGAFVAAAAAGGLLVAAFLSMTDAQKSMLSSAFKPLKAELVGLGQLMIRDMIPSFQTWSDNLQEAIGLAGPLASVMGEAFASAGNRLTAALAGPGFQNLFKAFRQDLPEITKRMSGALGGFLNGLAGIFAAISPLVLRFAGYLNRVAADFSEWANSASGQNAIVDFAERAVDSLESLWGFIKQFSGFVVDLLFSPQAQNSGNTLFDSLAKSFDGFRKKLQKAIEDGSLEKWFKDAIKFGGDMKDVIISIKDALVKLDNSGVLDAVGDSFVVLSDFIESCNKVLGPLVDFLGVQMGTAATAAETALNGIALGGFLGAIGGALDLANKLLNALSSIRGHGGESLDGAEQNTAPHSSTPGPSARTAPGWALGRTAADGGGGGGKGGGRDWAQHLIDLGNQALNSASGGGKGGSSGGSGSSGDGKDDDKKKWKNPLVKWALSLIKEGPTLARQLESAMTRMVTQINLSLNNAAKALDAEQARSILTTQMGALREAGRNGVQAARDALNSAAQNLASATTKKEAERALKAVRRAQRDLATALDNQKKLNKAGAALEDQREINPDRVNRLVNGLTAQNATLADFARARSILAGKIAKANADLEQATQLRDSYIEQVSSGVKAYGNLTTAQASVIDGVEQSLSASDITSNLETRLAKIKKFQENLRILLANGLSQSAYQQIVDAGVEGGSAYADALVAGGVGAVGSVNGLVSQIDTLAGQLGLETGNRLYQAGVDAAQGLVDGLESMAEELDAAATALGVSIARAIKKALGLGGGGGGGGNGGGGGGGQGKVVTGTSLSKSVAVSPEAAQYASKQVTSVSGNGAPSFTWNGDLVTPTEDPMAVATEVVNDITGRLL